MGAAVNNIRSFIDWHAERNAFGRRFAWKYISMPRLARPGGNGVRHSFEGYRCDRWQAVAARVARLRRSLRWVLEH